MPTSATFEALSDIDKEKLVCDVETALTEYAEDGQIVHSDSVSVVLGYK
jgi:hypothetical protein